jgi:hypothetical protein
MDHRNIFQLHGSYERLNAFERCCVERWKLLNPDWNYQFLTDEDIDPYVEHMWPSNIATYRTMETVQRAGVQRLAAVYRSGGLYADCDLYPTKPASEFIDTNRQVQMFKKEGREEERIIHDYLFFAEPQHPLIAKMIETAFYRTETTTPESHSAGCWKGWMFYSAGLHMVSDVATEAGISGDPGCADSIDQLRFNPTAYHTLHFSSEHWVKERRWANEPERETSDGLNCLNKLKRIYGI